MGERPESAGIVLENLDLGIQFDTWTSYRFSDHFLTPADGWSMTLGDESVGDQLIAKLQPGQTVRLTVNGHVTSTGYIDAVSVSTDRSSGTNVTLEGRDKMGAVVDGSIDPLTRFTANQTIFDVASAVLTPFNFSTLAVDNDVNKGVITGQLRGVKTTKKGKVLKSYQLANQLKPHPHEGAFAFLSRLTQRSGLWVWPSADGQFVVLAQPDFDQEKLYDITHKRGAAGAANNVISGHVRRDGGDQPSMIVATGAGTGGDNAFGQLRVLAVNGFTAYDAMGVLRPEVQQVLTTYRSAPVVQTLGVFPAWQQYPQKTSRIIYLHDDESHTIDQLTVFAKREMSLCQRKTLTATYVLEGHECNGMPWAIDTIVQVEDDVSNIHERMWVLSRTFTKDRSTGTRTTVELIRPGTMLF